MFALQVICILLLTLISAVLIGFGIYSPSWWTLDVIEYSQEWQFGLWMYCRRGGIPSEVGQSGVDLWQWICDMRSTVPNPENYRSQAAFVGSDHNETLGALWLATLTQSERLQC